MAVARSTSALRRSLVPAVQSAQASTLFGTTDDRSDIQFAHRDAQRGVPVRIAHELALRPRSSSNLYKQHRRQSRTLRRERKANRKRCSGTGHVASNTAKTWVAISLESSVAITEGTDYWIALEPASGGKVNFRDHVSGATDYEGSGLANPWSTIETYTDGPMSAYVTGEETERLHVSGKARYAATCKADRDHAAATTCAVRKLEGDYHRRRASTAR